jgi:tetratricopeptide (TPR) repeat protein
MKPLHGLIVTVACAFVLSTGAPTGPLPAYSAGKTDRATNDAPSNSVEPDAQDERTAEIPDSDIPDSDRVELLLDRLSEAGSAREAKSLERKIVMAWNQSGSDTIDLLVTRAAIAIKRKDYGLALQYLDTIVDSRPEFAEGWNMRATVYYLIDEYELSLADIQHVLALQPRHFGALSGLGMIFRDLDEPAKALDAFRQVLSVHPYFGNARESVEKLEPEVEGRDI